MSKYRIPKPQIPQKDNRFYKIILPKSQKTNIDDIKNAKVVFSFEFFDRSTELFNLGNTCVHWFVSLLDVLKDITSKTYNEFKNNHYSFYDLHPIDWNKTSTRFVFMNEQLEAYQFRLSKSKGRVQGFFIDNVFYIVWLDRHHNLYPDNGHYGGIKYYSPTPSCTEMLEKRIEELEEENRNLMKLLDTVTYPSL